MRCECRLRKLIPSYNEHRWKCILNDGFPYDLGYDCEKITTLMAMNAVRTIELYYKNYINYKRRCNVMSITKIKRTMSE
jgi:hypothetical protein